MRLSVLGLENVTENKKKKQQTRKKDKNYRNQVVIPYVECVSEWVDRVLKKHGVTTAMRPHTTLTRLLVHPNDKVELEEQGELLYKILCKSCGAAYVRETGRLFKTRLIEHKKGVENAHTKNST